LSNNDDDDDDDDEEEEVTKDDDDFERNLSKYSNKSAVIFNCIPEIPVLKFFEYFPNLMNSCPNVCITKSNDEDDDDDNEEEVLKHRRNRSAVLIN